MSAPRKSIGATVPRIAGIGASAGGLEAFRELLRALPTDTGAAFVLVQHLEPEPQSAIAVLLARVTTMPVEQARERMRVESNHVYVNPPDSDLRVLNGALHVSPRKEALKAHVSIDVFLESLARAEGARAIGVILSGTGSDGTAGIRSIKEHGGIVLAQDPESAEFDAMPRNAIASGCVDCVLSPGLIAGELARIVRHAPAGAEDPQWERLFHLLRSATGIDFSRYRRSMLSRRLARRMQGAKARSLGDYLKTLEHEPAELAALSEDFLIRLTGFFREPEVFVALKKKILPEILKDKPPGEPIRIWDAGCSTGEEAYSLAISLIEFLEEKGVSRTTQFFATDTGEKSIHQARLGLYSAAKLAKISKGRVGRFFERADGKYRVSKALRETCVFARHDIGRDPPFSRLDLLCCRNLLRYLDPALQAKVFANFHFALKDNGILLLGKGETTAFAHGLFAPVDARLRYFRKNPGAHSASYAPNRVYVSSESNAPLDTKEVEEIIRGRSGYGGLVIEKHLRILRFVGEPGPYLHPIPGNASLQLLRMLHEDLMLGVLTGLRHVQQEGKAAHEAGIAFRHNGQTNRVNIEIHPLVGAGSEENFLVLFEPASEPASHRAETGGPGQANASRNREAKELSALREELVRTKEYLQATLRDSETSSEELAASSQELLSSMEELQSTNEELETAKEQLQSSNEQLQNRNSELLQLSSDLNNILAGVGFPIVVLGPDRCIRRFTPQAGKLLRLTPADVGRPFGHFRMGFDIPDPDKLISKAIDKRTEAIMEVKADSGRWFLLRVHPFAGRGELQGVLIAFIDIHELKEHQEAIQRDKDFISAILDAAKDLLVVVLDREGKISHFNAACQKLTGYSLDEVRGRSAEDFLIPQGELESVRAISRELAEGGAKQNEHHWITKDGRRLLISWSNNAVKSAMAVESIISTGIDVTAREEARRRAKESELTIHMLLDSAAEAILACDRQGHIVFANPAAEKVFGYAHDALVGHSVEALIPKGLRVPHKAYRSEWSAEPHSRPMSIGLDLFGVRMSGEEFPIEVSLSSIETSEETLRVAFVSDITERRNKEKTLLEYKDQLQKLTGALIVAQEAGNRELARELHDVFSQEVAAIGMELSSLKEKLGPNADAVARVTDLGQRIRRLSTDLHRASRELHPSIIEELGLTAALRQECESFQESTGISTEFIAAPLLANPPRDVAVCLYRVVQESLRNVHKHSQSPRVVVRLSSEPNGIRLSLEDWGDGFDPDQALKKGGLGLISMEERVRLVNGKLAIESAPGKGTIVTAFVPLEKEMV